ncbi:unnamed protein product [Cuscuta europaea]|uniref:Pentatricopeptide repeat-containing protein n=1 Tax=Cuscuta europaea TaxID=41803 RepID=A0A9P0YK42_CUSEU|nr:unnamed protein product [Cuscuta europaea]
MHRISSKRHLFVSISKLPLIPFNKSTNAQCLYATYLSKLNHPNQTHKRNFSNESQSISSKPVKTFDLIHLQSVPEEHGMDHNKDEFTGDVEKIYRILKRFHSRVPTLERALQESGIIVRSGLTERVLNRCGDAGNLGYGFFVWVSKQPGYTHTYDVYKAMIKILGKMRQFGAVWALIEEMRRENPQLLSSEVFVILMRRFASARMVKKAVNVLDEMAKYGVEADEHVFGCLLDALCKNGSVKDASKLFDEMSFRFKPTIKHFTSLLYGWCKEGKLIEAKVVLVKMREAGFEPDIVVYNNLLTGYTVAGKMSHAFDLLQEMRHKGCHPNAASFTVVIQSLCSQRKMEEAARVFSEMESHGSECDVVTYNALISGFCKSDGINKAYELLDRMAGKGCTPNQTTYLHIMLAHEKKEELDECLELIKKMEKTPLTLDLPIYNTVIRLALKLGETDEAARLWNESEANGLSPGVDTFVIMINGLIEQRCVVEACDYFKEMVGRGLFSFPHYGTLKDLLNSVLREEKLEMGKDVWGCIMGSGCEVNVCGWTIWIHALFSRGHVKEGCAYCLDMMDGGLMPQPDTFAKLMRGLRKMYNRQIAGEITEKVRKMAEEAGMSFKMYKRRGERDLKEKVKEMKDGRKRRARRRRWGSEHSKCSHPSKDSSCNMLHSSF